MSINAAACLPAISHKKRLRKVQKWAGRVWHSVLLTRKCSLTMNVVYAQAIMRSAAATMKGFKQVIEGGNSDVLISAHCKTACDRYATLHNILATSPPSPTLRVGCQRRALSRADDATAARKFVRAVADPTRLLIAPSSSRHFACDGGL